MQTSTLPKAYSQALKGFLSLVIVGTHLRDFLTVSEVVPLWLSLSSLLTPLALGLYFFFSGFGLMTQMKMKEERLPDVQQEERWRGWLPRRLWGLLKPFLFFFVLSFCFEYISQGLHTLSWESLGSKLINVVRMSRYGLFRYPPTAWFLVELMVLYVLFFVSFRWIRSKRVGLLILTLLIGAFIFVIGRLNFPTFWLRYPFVFALGAYYAYAEDKVYRNLMRFLPVVVISLIPLGWWYVKGTQGLTSFDPTPWIQAIMFFLATNILPLLVVMLSKRFGMTDLFMRKTTGWWRKALLFLGDISLEIYLLHISFVYLFRGPTIYIHSTWGYILVVYACTLLGAYLLMRYCKRLVRA